MYNRRSFEEEGFSIYVQGMLDYKSICEQIVKSKYDEPEEDLEILNESYELFCELAK